MTTNNDEQPDLLRRLNRLNPTVVVFGTLALFLAVLFLPDLLGGVLILILVGALGWLLTKTWPVLAPVARTLRVLVIALLLAVAAVKILG
jgi:hypothetical protein